MTKTAVYIVRTTKNDAINIFATNVNIKKEQNVDRMVHWEKRKVTATNKNLLLPKEVNYARLQNQLRTTPKIFGSVSIS